MNLIKKHIKLYILLILEVVWLGLMISTTFEAPAFFEFLPKDFMDTTLDRTYITCDDDCLHIAYNPSFIIHDDEGHVIEDDVFSPKFAIGSGGYYVIVRYDATDLNSYVKLHTDSEITETFAIKEYLVPDKKEMKARLYIPFARSVHDAQIDIAYTGPGDISIYSIQIVEDTGYRWVPIVGCILLFFIIDFLILVLFGRSWGKLRSFIRSHYEIPVLAGIILLASLPLISGSLYWGHDIDFHLARIIAVSHEIGYGQFPIRMLTDMLQGYGYPTSTFYSDLFLYPFAALYYCGLPLRHCWQLYIFIVNIITATISYYSFNSICREKDIALIGAAIYVLSSYRIVDLYLRCAMGEFTAIAFIPLVMLGIWNILYEEKYRSGWRQLAAGMTLTALCHLLTVEMVSLFLLMLCILEYHRFLSTFKVFFSILKAAVTTTLLSSWFIIPMLISMKAIPLKMYDNQLYIQSQGAHPSQLFNIFMSGSGFTTPGTYHEMPLSIGGGIIAAYMLLIYVMFRSHFENRHMQRTAFCISSLALIMSTYLFPWDTIASLTEGRLNSISRLARMVQYPWRYIEIVTAVLTLSAVMLLRMMKRRNTSVYIIWVAILASGTLISLYSFYMPFVNEAKTISASDELFIDNEIGLEEYLPSEAGIVEDMGTLPVLLDGTADISSYYSEKGSRYLSIKNCTSDSSIALPVFAYPGYHAIDVNTGQSFTLSNTDDERIEILLPKEYEGTVRLFYSEPISWRLFELVSLVSFLTFLSFEVHYQIQTKKQHDPADN
jgi:hypothetical protein